MSKKRCSLCHKKKPVSEFDKRSKKGERRDCRCKACNRQRQVENYGTLGGRSRVLMNNARKRAKQKDLEFTLKVEWVLQKLNAGVCEVTGLPFSFDLPGKTRNHPFAPSLDRRNPALGYTPDNVQVVVWSYNCMKSEYDEETVYRLAEAVVRCGIGRSN